MSFRRSFRCISGWRNASALCVATFGILISTPAQAEPFSLVCMPDPQYYTTSNHPALYNLYQKQAQWIRDNKTARNVQHVIWLGDLTNDNTNTQWLTAHAAYSTLDAANVPFAVVPGNHDYKSATGWPGSNVRNLAKFNTYVGPLRFASKPWYGGNMGETSTNNENNYTYFSSNGLDFLVIGLEYAPRKEVLTWANNLISQHPNHRVILFTHGYMTTNGNYTGNAGSAFGIVGASGADIYEECASRHSNVFMVACGHVTESVVNTKSGIAGNTVYEMLVDYQSEKVKGTGANLGNGWLRVLQFDPATNKINADTITVAAGDPAIFTNGVTTFYNGPYGKSPTAPDHVFSLNYNMGAMLPYTYLNDSLGFHAMGVNNDLHSDQLDADMGQDAHANWATVWEDDSDDNGIYQVLLRGFDSDGNVRFARSVVNTAGVNTGNAVNPAMAMAPDGRFVVVWQTGSSQIKMRAYNADGSPIGNGEQTVVTVTAPGSVANPDVAVDDAGNFVVVWADDGDGNNTFQIRARGFASTYAPRFDAKTVNTVSAGQQLNPVVAMAGNGDYVVAWEDDKDGTWDLGMRGFFADETERFAQTVANFTITGEQRSPDIAMDDAGRFVVVWEDDADLNTSFQIRARGFAPTGAEMFSERTVNGVATGNQINPAVDMDAYGNWYPVWEDNGVSGDGYQIMSNAFNVTGTRINDTDIRANPITAVTHRFGPSVRKNPMISAHKSGRYIVGWADDMDGDGLHQTLARGLAGTAKSLVIKSINGSVTRSDKGPFYPTNAPVTLTATAEPGHSFVRWSGDVPAGSQTANPLTITMNSNKKVTAEFSGSASVSDYELY